MKLFDMMTSEDIKRLNTSTIEELIERVKKLESSRALDTMDEVAYRELQMKNERLKEDLAREKEDHQYDNLVHANELKNLKSKKHRINQK